MPNSHPDKSAARKPKRSKASPTQASGTKRERLIAMLGSADGASAQEISAAFGWLPHTTRAALSGLRKAGFTLSRTDAPGQPARYRMEGFHAESAS